MNTDGYRGCIICAKPKTEAEIAIVTCKSEINALKALLANAEIRLKNMQDASSVNNENT